MLPNFLNFPSKIQLQTINRCNYTCTMCPYPEASIGYGRTEIDAELFRRLIEEVRAAKRKVKLCLMLQNEPLLDRRFIEFLDYAHRAEDAITSISSTTNGSMLTEELLDQLVAYERFYLTISVNAIDSERYKKVHNRDLWSRIHQLLTNWSGRREWVRLSFVMDSTTVQEARAFRNYWQEYGYQTRLVPINSRVNSIHVASPLHLVDGNYGHCHYPVDTLNVLSDGSVILCCNDWARKREFGNLYSNTIEQVWNSPKLVALRTAAIKGVLRSSPMCKNCDYPMRSSERIRLEVLVSDELSAQVQPSKACVAEHVAAIDFAGRGSAAFPLLVWDINEETGTILAFTERLTDISSQEIRFAFPIGHSGAFSFGSLETVWCPGKLDVYEEVPNLGNLTALRIVLDQSSAEFEFFQWYYNDWRLTDYRDRV